nr:uncharacterized protein LOC111414142 [Onthophagus taurus]
MVAAVAATADIKKGLKRRSEALNRNSSNKSLKIKTNNDRRIQYSRWQRTENPHTMRLRLQRVKSGVPQQESAESHFHIMPSFSDSENASESSRSKENENITNETEDKAENTQADRKRKGKKRKANLVEWKKSKAKLLRNTGKPYTSSSIRKTEMQARKVRPACNEKCKQQCSRKIEENKRLEIFNKYWSLGSLKSQREFIGRSMTAVTPRYQYKREGSTRQCNHAFHFVINEVNVRVCKFFFKATLDINDRPIRTVISKLNEGFLQEDLRGKHGHHSKIDAAIKDSVIAHINTIPRIDSHYLRAQTTGGL